MIQPERSFTVEKLPVEVYPTNQALGQAAARRAVEILQAAIAERGQANLVLATGNSQLTFLQVLGQLPGVDWSKVQIFHMDEYAGMKPDHPASFRRFLHEKIIDIVHPAAFHGITGDAADLQGECSRYASLLQDHPADLCALGIGENGHLAFNDPPYADFSDPARVKIVRLDEKSRRQQVGEGHFPSLEDVPTHALTMTIPALLAARAMLCIVPEARKAEAVRSALNGPLTENCPASLLRKASHCRLYLDAESAGLLSESQR
jgi:glucosamine-6-phosphate deaminase